LGFEALDEGAEEEFGDEGHAVDGFSRLLGSIKNQGCFPDF